MRAFLTERKLAAYTAVVGIAMLLIFGALHPRRHSRLPTAPMRVGFRHMPPYYTRGNDGTAGGLTVDVLNEAARRSGIRLVWVEVPQGPDFALETEKVDLWPMLTDIPERNGRFHITEPWMQNQFCLMSPARAAIRSPRETRGKRVALANNWISSRLARQFLAGSS